MLSDQKVRGDGEKIKVAESLIEAEKRLNMYEKQGFNVGRYKRRKRRKRNSICVNHETVELLKAEKLLKDSANFGVLEDSSKAGNQSIFVTHQIANRCY